MPELIAVEELHKSFGHAEALRGVSFTVAESALVVIIGPSGCGKSTLLRCLNGLELFDSGRVHRSRRRCVTSSCRRPCDS